MSGLREVIKETIAAVDPLCTDERLAMMVAQRFATFKAYREATWPLLVDEIRRRRRLADFNEQPVARAALRQVRIEGAIPSDPTEERTEWLRMRLLVPGREAVLFVDATVEDHQARIAYLLSLRNGIDSSIELHRQAIEIIEQRHVSRLSDLQEYQEAV